MKTLRVAELVYRTAVAAANRNALLVRDNLGPRIGRGFSGKLGN